MLKSKYVRCYILLYIFAAPLSFADNLASQRSLCYFTAYLDDASQVPHYLYSVKIGDMTGDGKFMLDEEGRPYELDITSLKLGNGFSLSGIIGLNGSHALDLTINIERLDLSTLLKTLLSDRANSTASGFVEGKIKIDGSIDIPRIAGRIKSHSLKVGNIDYNFSYVDLRGTWPFVFVDDGMLFYEGGYLAISGYIDLANLPDPSAWDNIVCESDKKSLRWRGWDIGKGGSDESGYRADGLNIGREYNGDIRVSLKAFMNNEVSTRSVRDDELELEYKMGNKNIRMRLRQRDEFLGMEHNLKF